LKREGTEKIDPTDTDTEPIREPPRPILWASQPVDTAGRMKEWERFSRWAEWFLSHWEVDDTVIPPCWVLHSSMVEELTALWNAWQGAYTPSAAPSAPAAWHEIMGKAIARIQESDTAKRCARNDLHKPRHLRSATVFPESLHHMREVVEGPEKEEGD